MEFSKHDLYVLKRAIAHAILRNSALINAAKKRAEGRRGNSRPGAIASLAMEGADYQRLWERFKKELPSD